jgi:hypothetical protein
MFIFHNYAMEKAEIGIDISKTEEDKRYGWNQVYEDPYQTRFYAKKFLKKNQFLNKIRSSIGTA